MAVLMLSTGAIRVARVARSSLPRVRPPELHYELRIADLALALALFGGAPFLALYLWKGHYGPQKRQNV